MKRIIILFVIIFLFCIAPTKICYAESDEKEVEELTKRISEEIEKVLTSSDMNDFVVFVRNFDSNNEILGKDVLDYIRSLSEGKVVFSPTEALSCLTGGLLKEILALTSLIISVTVIAALNGMSSGLVSSFNSKSTSKIINIVCISAIIVLISTEMVLILQSVIKTISLLGRFSEVVFPLVLGLISTLGGLSTVGVFKPAAAVFSGFIIKFFDVFIVPLFLCVLVLNIVGKLFDSVKLGKFSSFLTSLGKWSMATVFGVFLSVVTAGGIVGATYDGVSVRTARFALQSYVPVLGGYLSDGFDIVLAGASLVKNAVGLTGLVLLLGMVLLPLTKCVSLILALKFTSAVTEPLSARSVSDILDGTAETLKLLVGVLLGGFFMGAGLLFLTMIVFNV